jgi:hypothetical protein
MKKTPLAKTKRGFRKKHPPPRRNPQQELGGGGGKRGISFGKGCVMDAASDVNHHKTTFSQNDL